VRLVYTWRQEAFALGQLTHVDIRFEPVGDETRIKVEYDGWDAIPQSTLPIIIFLTPFFCAVMQNGGKCCRYRTTQGSWISERLCRDY